MANTRPRQATCLRQPTSAAEHRNLYSLRDRYESGFRGVGDELCVKLRHHSSSHNPLQDRNLLGRGRQATSALAPSPHRGRGLVERSPWPDFVPGGATLDGSTLAPLHQSSLSQRAVCKERLFLRPASALWRPSRGAVFKSGVAAPQSCSRSGERHLSTSTHHLPSKFDHICK